MGRLLHLLAGCGGRDHFRAFLRALAARDGVLARGEAALAQDGRPLPRSVEGEFEDFLKCGRLEYGFLRVRCNDCHAEKWVAFSGKRAATGR